MDFSKLLQQAKVIQEKCAEAYKEAKEKRGNTEFHGQVGGEIGVEITLNGLYKALRAKISSQLIINLQNKEIEVEMLEDLICAAFNNAVAEIQNSEDGDDSNFANNIPLPPELKNLSLLQQAKVIQEKCAEAYKEAKEKRGNTEFHGQVGGEIGVEITLNGLYKALRAKISSQLIINLQNKEIEVEMLEDLICAAFNNAVAEIQNSEDGDDSNFANNIPLPPELKNLL